MVIAPDLPSPGNEVEHRGRGGGCLETDKVDSIDVVINCKEMFIFMVVVDVVVVVAFFFEFLVSLWPRLPFIVGVIQS